MSPSPLNWYPFMTRHITILAGLMGLIFAGTLNAQQPPSYVKHIRPFFAKYCLECHSANKPKGGLNLETFKSLMEGGKRGEAIAPGDADQSLLVRTVEGDFKPTMPPKKSKQPPAKDVKLL